MRITRLYIENFRSIQGPFSLPLGQLNALVGQNNTGKTNVLLAIKKILASTWLSVNTFSEDDVYQRDPDRDIVIAFDLDPPYPYRAFKEADPVAIKTIKFTYTRYKTGPNAGQRRLQRDCFGPDGKMPYVLAKAPRRGEQPKFQPLTTIPSEILESLPVVYIDADRQLKQHLPNARYSLLRILLEDVDRYFQESSDAFEIANQAGGKETLTRPQLFARYLTAAMDLLRIEQFNSLERSIKVNALKQLGLDPLKDTDKLDFSFSPFTSEDFYKALKLLVKENNFSIEATELGGGIQNALLIAILKAFEERKKQKAILVIEEPEMYLHPQMQRAFYKTLREIGTTNQVIYATHSPHFLTIPEYNEVTIIRKDANGTDKRVSTLPIDKVRREKIRKEFDPERNELFFARKLLLVEGDTEKLAIPEYAGKKGLNLDTIGATIVEVGGKKSLLEFANIAISFSIPTGVVYDEDSVAFNKDEKDKESGYNRELDALARADGTVKVWRLDKKYEDELRRSLGEKEYQRLCQKYPGYTNPIRQRLIAMDAESKAPEFVKQILRWLIS